MPVEIILVGWCIVVGAVMYHVGKRKGWSECEHYFIAKVMVEHDFDTNPSQEFQYEMFSWICHTLNAAIDKRYAVPTVDGEQSFQERVKPWMLACFGEEISNDKLERGDRFLEESLELLQSGNYPKERIYALIDYVFNRPVGEPSQEVGGVMATLAAYCLAHGLDMHEAGEVELARIWTKVEKIREKQKAKPTGSALPVATVDGEPVAWMLDHVPNNAQKQIVHTKECANREMDKGHNDNTGFSNRYPYHVCLPLFTYQPDAAAKIAELQLVLKDERKSANELTKSLVEKVSRVKELEADNTELMKALDKLLQSKHEPCLRLVNPMKLCNCIYCEKDRCNSLLTKVKGK